MHRWFIFFVAGALSCKSDPAPSSSAPPDKNEAAATQGEGASAAGQPTSAAAPSAPSGTAAPPSSAASGEVSGGAWRDLMPDDALAGFVRVPLDPLAEKPVWRGDDERELLIIDGVSAKEMLLHDEALGDGVLRVRWRFVPSTVAGYKYNGGVYVRTALDGKSYVQLQVAEGDEPPVVGDLIAQVPGQSERVNVYQKAASPARPVGEWNLYEITMRGASIELSVNGKHTISWNGCPMRTGHVGLQAEGALIEVSDFQFKPL